MNDQFQSFQQFKTKYSEFSKDSQEEDTKKCKKIAVEADIELYSYFLCNIFLTLVTEKDVVSLKFQYNATCTSYQREYTIGHHIRPIFFSQS